MLGWGPSINKIWAGNLGPVDLKLSNFCLNGLFKFKESHPVRNLILTSFTVWKSRNRRAITLEARWNPKCSRWKIAKRNTLSAIWRERVRDQVLRGYYVWLDVVEWRTGAQRCDLIVERILIRSAVAFIWAGQTERQEETRERRTGKEERVERLSRRISPRTCYHPKVDHLRVGHKRGRETKRMGESTI